MSGIKDTTVTMTRRERDRLVNNANRARIDVKRANKRANAADAARKQAETKMQDLRYRLEQSDSNVRNLQREIDRGLANVNSQVEAMRKEQDKRLAQAARESEKRLKSQAKEFDIRLNQQENDFSNRLDQQEKELVQMVNSVKSEMKEDMSRQESKMNQSIQQNRKELEQQIAQSQELFLRELNQISDRVEREEHRQQKHKELAEFWIHQAERVFQEIKAYRHELFTPGELDVLLRNVTESRMDVDETENYQTAIGTARNTFHEALELKERVIQAEMEWNGWYSMVSQLYNNVKENLADLDTMKFEFETVDENEEEEVISVDADIDYWTNGGLSQIMEQLKTVGRQFENADQMSSSELEAMLGQLTQIQGNMNQLEAESRIAIQISQERRELACDIVEALTEGFSFDEGTGVGLYCKDDFRDAYEGTIKNLVTNDQVSFRILPVKNEEGFLTNQMELHYFSDTNELGDADKMLQAIHDVIQNNGTEIGSLRCRSGYEHKASDEQKMRKVEGESVLGGSL